MNKDHSHYQEARIVFRFWKFTIQKAIDGSGATWIVIRLFDGKKEKRKLLDLSQEYGSK